MLCFSKSSNQCHSDIGFCEWGISPFSINPPIPYSYDSSDYPLFMLNLFIYSQKLLLICGYQFPILLMICKSNRGKSNISWRKTFISENRKHFSFILCHHKEPGPVVRCLGAETGAGTETGRGMSLTLLTVPGYSTAPVVCFWGVIFQPPGVYLQDTHPSWETHQCHTLAVGRHIAQCWVSEWARQRGWGWRWQTNRESRAALLCVQPCWSSDSLGMKPSRSRHLYPVRDPTRDCTERAIRSSTAGPFEHKLPAPLPSLIPAPI